MLQLQTGAYPTAEPCDIKLTGSIREPIDSTTGQVADDWNPAFSAIVHAEPIALPHIATDHLEECWSYVFISDDHSDRLGPSLPLTIGSNEVIMDDIGGGIYIASTDGKVAESIEAHGGELSFGGASPGIGMPEAFDLHERSDTWAGMADSGLLSLSWTPGTGAPEAYILVTGLGSEHPDVEDEENFVCALEDDGSAVIDLGRPRPDISLAASRAQSSLFDTDYGTVLATLLNGDVFLTSE